MRRPCSPLMHLAGALLVAFHASPLQAQTADVDAAPAQGFIVRLKQPATNDSQFARGGSARAREAAAAVAQGESLRWRRVLSETGLSGSSGRREPRLRAVGRDQQLIQFEQPLSRAEAQAVREKLMQRGDVEWVEPNTRERRLQVPPTDPLFTQQWWLQPVSGSNANAIDARLRGVAGFQNAWLRAQPTSIVVAVLDTGITPHEDLSSSRILPGRDFVSEVDYANDGDGWDADPSDPGDYVTSADLANPAFNGCVVENSSWHGTIVAGIVAATPNNGRGGAGIHWGAQVLPVRVAGKCGAAVSDIVDGMRWAAGLQVYGDNGAPLELNKNPARVLNISFGGSDPCGQAYQSAVDELKAHGVIVVAAAGNEWASTPTRPASCNGVVGVVGLNRDGFKTNYSNFGSQLSASGIATVSGDDREGAWGSVLADSGLVTLTNQGSTVPLTGGYARLYGTSFAAPQVSGTIAEMLSLNPGLSVDQILTGLRLSARPHVTSSKIGQCSDANPGRCICTTSTCGVGILDADQALAYAQQPASYVPPVRAAAIIDNADVDAALALAPQDRAPNTSPVAGGDSGGGAFGGFWLLALAVAAVTLPFVRPRPQRG